MPEARSRPIARSDFGRVDLHRGLAGVGKTAALRRLTRKLYPHRQLSYLQQVSSYARHFGRSLLQVVEELRDQGGIDLLQAQP